MALILSPANESDADRIATIHMAAFGANLLLRAQFPTAAIRDELRTCIAEKALADIRDAKTAVLVIRDNQNEIISFAKWSLPVFESEIYVEPPWRWPEGTNLAVLDEWTKKVEAAEKKVLGGGPCYRMFLRITHGQNDFPTLRHELRSAYLALDLSFVGTDPLHERRGAASLLLQWGLTRCNLDSVSAYLESTVDAGPLYEKHGFTFAEKISMILKGKGGESVIYEEVCFIFRPGVMSCTIKPQVESTV